MSKKRKRGFGPSGSSFTSRDAYGFVPGMDPDVAWDYKKRLVVPPARLPADAPSHDEFMDAIRDQEAKMYTVMDMDLFTKLVSDPTVAQTRKTRSERERMLAVMEHFGKMDERYWVDTQIQILYWLKRQREENDSQTFKVWETIYLKRLKKAVKYVRKEYPEMEKAFLEGSYAYYKSKMPEKRSKATQVIITQIWRMVLEGKRESFQLLSDQLHPLLDEWPED